MATLDHFSPDNVGEWIKGAHRALKTEGVTIAEAYRVHLLPTDETIAQAMAEADRDVDAAAKVLEGALAVVESHAAMRRAVERVRRDAVAYVVKHDELGRGKRYTQTTLAKELGITQGRVSQIKAEVEAQAAESALRQQVKEAIPAGLEGVPVAAIAREGEEAVAEAIKTLNAGKMPAVKMPAVKADELAKVAARAYLLTSERDLSGMTPDQRESVARDLRNALRNLEGATV